MTHSIPKISSYLLLSFSLKVHNRYQGSSDNIHKCDFSEASMANNSEMELEEDSKRRGGSLLDPEAGEEKGKVVPQFLAGGAGKLFKKKTTLNVTHFN